jgi:hypothetical protein
MGVAILAVAPALEVGERDIDHRLAVARDPFAVKRRLREAALAQPEITFARQ